MGNDPQAEPPRTGAHPFCQAFSKAFTALRRTPPSRSSQRGSKASIESMGHRWFRNPADQLRLVVFPHYLQGSMTSQVQDFFHQQYFINLDFPEGDFPDFPSSTTFWEPRSCEVARIWSVTMSSSWKFSFWPKKQGICLSQKQKYHTIKYNPVTSQVCMSTFLVGEKNSLKMN